MPTVLGRFKTDAGLQKLVQRKPPSSGKVYFKDEASTGLYLSLSCRNLAAWELQLRGAGMKTIGYYHDSDEATSLADARAIAKKARSRHKSRLDPFPPSKKFCDVWSEFEERHVAKLAVRSREAYLYLRRLIGTRWDRRNVGQISSDDCQRVLEDVELRASADARSKTGGRSAVNNAHACLTKFFRLAWERSLIDVSPMARLPRPYPTAVRDRVLDAHELVSIWNAADEEQYPYKQLVRFAMLVPLRIWSDVAPLARQDVVNGKWTVLIQKTQVQQILQLPETAVALLDECPPASDFYFSRSGQITNGSRGALRRRMAERTQIAPWTFHDFRTAFHTQLRELGAPFDLVDQIQRPASRRKTAGGRHYDHSLLVEDKAELLQYWSDVVFGWLNGKEPVRWRER